MSLRLTSISSVNSPFLPLRIIMNLSGVPNGGAWDGPFQVALHRTKTSKRHSGNNWNGNYIWMNAEFSEIYREVILKQKPQGLSEQAHAKF